MRTGQEIGSNVGRGMCTLQRKKTSAIFINCQRKDDSRRVGDSRLANKSYERTQMGATKILP
jgi:hypothetical protein